MLRRRLRPDGPAWTCRQMQLACRVFGRMTGLVLLGFGAELVLLGATGHDFLSRLYSGGAVRLNDAVPGSVILAAGLVLLRVAGRAPLQDQVRAMRYWGGAR